jgi:tryptophan halogenase
MQDYKIRNIVIVGGGTAGWMAAAAFARLLVDPEIKIRLVESEAIGTVGVGESTVPPIRYFNRLLAVREDEFMRRTNATFKVGIEFVNWSRIGERYFHPFGPYGVNMEGLHFHHFWYRYARTGKAHPLEEYSLQALAARHGKFQLPDPQLPDSPLGTISYAFQFDAGLYAKFLRAYAEARGVERIEGTIVEVRQHPESGNVESVVLASGQQVSGDFFVDCSGFRGLLIEQTLHSGYDDWSHWLPCDRAVARASANVGEPAPYTRATAKKVGWQWRIPLQSRTGNGYVYYSEYLSDEEALESLNADLAGEPLSEPNFLKFKAGIRKKPWHKNVVSLGLASGFLEPLESTSIHFIHTAIGRLMTNFPDKAFNQADIDFYNQRTRIEYEHVRDFLILHYHASQRDDSPFWQYCRTMPIPDTLAQRIALFKENARVHRLDNELFAETSWLAIMHGQHIEPQRYHPLADMLPAEELDARMTNIWEVTQKCCALMPTHQAFIDRYCKAETV